MFLINQLQKAFQLICTAFVLLKVEALHLHISTRTYVVTFQVYIKHLHKNFKKYLKNPEKKESMHFSVLMKADTQKSYI